MLEYLTVKEMWLTILFIELIMASFCHSLEKPKAAPYFI